MQGCAGQEGYLSFYLCLCIFPISPLKIIIIITIFEAMTRFLLPGKCLNFSISFTGFTGLAACLLLTLCN